MRPFYHLIVGAAFVAFAAACDDDDATSPPPAGDVELELTPIVSSLDQPVHVASPTSDPRLFVVEREGRIRVVKNGTLLTTPFLDITALVESGSQEQGLLSVAFHPQYASNGFFYVHYTDAGGNNRIDRFTASSANPDVANPASQTLILSIPQTPPQNHNGGLNVFGPDGNLYIAVGDGGGTSGRANGQNPNTLLGKILRIDVDGGNPYAIPPDNPFVNQTGVRPEIWALGFRNPWRFSIDPVTNLVYIADVGESSREEINIVPTSASGRNFGWAIMEGSSCFGGGTSCDRTGLTLPAFEYGRDDGCAVIGGSVYRGSNIPELRGYYFFADLCQRELRAFRYLNNSVDDLRTWTVDGFTSIFSLGTDALGELYLLALSGSSGTLYRIDKVTDA